MQCYSKIIHLIRKIATFLKEKVQVLAGACIMKYQSNVEPILNESEEVERRKFLHDFHFHFIHFSLIRPHSITNKHLPWPINQVLETG